MRGIHVVAIGALFVALLEMPYGYYQLLRVGICLGSAFLALRAFEEQKNELVWALVANVLIYNPVAPLALGRELWTVVNVVTAAIFIWSYATFNRRDNSDKMS
jgi:hypothetical protein